MSFTDNDIRASHTIRIFGTNKNKDVLQHIWLDIERIDIYRITTKSPAGQFQGVYRRLYWLDDPKDPEYAGEHPARSEGLKKICSPDEADQEDPEEWIPVKTIIEMAWNETTDNNQWNARRGNRTDAENLVRAVAARRCFHRDTIIDAEVDKATTNDPGLKAYVVASDQYAFKGGADDKDSYIEVQYVSFTLDQSSRKEDEGKDQGVQTALKNIHYLAFTDPAKGPVNPVHGFDPPWALDPFQAIVNVNWKSLYLYVRVGAGNSRNGEPGPNPIATVDKPVMKVTSSKEKTSIRELDKLVNDFSDYAFGCFQYVPEQENVIGFDPETGAPVFGPIGHDAQTAYDIYASGTTSAGSEFFPPTDGVCIVRNTEIDWATDGVTTWTATVNTVQVNYSSTEIIQREYLYRIPAGDELITVDVSELLASSSSPPTQDGSADILVSVYSRAREPIRKLDQLIRYGSDTNPKLDPDDSCRLALITSENQGEFKINVRLETDKGKQQTDNYGKTFVPYKVTLHPSEGSEDLIPPQPPARLPLPVKKATA